MRQVALRTCAVAAALAGCGAIAVPSGTAAAATPPLLWRDVSSLRIHCLVNGPAGVDRAQGDRLCGRVRALAARGAPMPVGIIGPGDPALLAPNTMTLLVHGSIQPSVAGPLLAFAIRPFRNGAVDGLLFAAAPRAVLIADNAALDAALGAALSETLPWLARPAGPRPITR